MTLSDLDLATRIREQRTRVQALPPAPADLAQRIRERAREQRRRRMAMTAAGVAAALVFVGLPVLASGFLGDGSRGESAAPVTTRRAPAPSYLDLATRGSLAGDEEWLAGVRGLSWLPADLASYPPEAAETLPDPAVEDRQVVFAGDVPGGRVAVVMARLENGQLVQAWFTGPGDAEPGDMTLALQPTEAPRTDPFGVVARPDPTSPRTVLVLIGQPGDAAEVRIGHEVDASGAGRDLWEPVTTEDGIGISELREGLTFPPGLDVRHRRPGQQAPLFAMLQYQDDVVDHASEPVEVADPRGLLPLVDADELHWTVTELLARFGQSARTLRPTLLAGGPAGTGSPTSALLVGVTFPSGATAAHLATYRQTADGAMTTTTTSLDPAPAGTALLDRLIAAATGGVVTVSGPGSGTTAEIYRDDGTLAATVPLVDGAGVGAIPPPRSGPVPRVATVRVLDARGAVVAESPLEQTP